MTITKLGKFAAPRWYLYDWLWRLEYDPLKYHFMYMEYDV